MKPGYQTWGFWVKILGAAGAAGLGAFSSNEAGLPDEVSGAVGLLIPLVAMWLNKKFSTKPDAAAVAEAGKAAAAKVDTLDKAADVFKRKPQ